MILAQIVAYDTGVAVPQRLHLQELLELVANRSAAAGVAA